MGPRQRKGSAYDHADLRLRCLGTWDQTGQASRPAPCRHFSLHRQLPI